MEQSNTIILENKKEYNIVNKLIYESTEYVLLSNTSNLKDICIRKIIKEGVNNYICRLDSEEVDVIFNKFVESTNTSKEQKN